MYDVIIIGGGPAGLTAAIYTGRAKLKTLVLEAAMLGGNAGQTDLIDNYPGFPFGISGSDLMDNFLKQAERFVNDNERGILTDIDNMLESIAPFGPDYLHHRTGEDNGDAHLKSILVHHQIIVPVTGGDLDLGPWQQIFYAEFDGRRKKRVIIKVMGE